ncbi:MAG: monofunctional biosynthetic peptidoglycan transglycosylase [Beijerinckiaceae bacterium]
MQATAEKIAAPPSPQPGGGKSRSGVLRRLLRWIFRLALLLLLLLAGLVALWAVAPPVSTLMLGRWAAFRPVERQWVPLERISPNLIAAVVMSEDGQFCRHNGVDWKALDEQINAEDGPARGASTIPMQVAKNLFLWPQRSFIRKGLELPLALVLAKAWPRRRILEVYLNIAEWGDRGLFGAEAAARRYFGKSAVNLTRREAALLATALPNPFIRNPARPRRHHLKLAQINMARARGAGPWLDCLKEKT